MTFVYRFLPELLEFETFVKQKSKITKLDIGILTSVEMKEFIQRFSYKHPRPRKPKKIKLYTPLQLRYRDMMDGLENCLQSDADFPRLLSTKLIPAAKKFDQMVAFFENNLQYFKEELVELDMELDFEKLKSMADLIARIKGKVTLLKKYLSSSNEMDEAYFKSLITCARYEALVTFLGRLTHVKFKTMKEILKDPDYETYAAAIRDACGESIKQKTPIEEDVSIFASCFNPLFFGINRIPVTENYCELAPALYKLVDTETPPGKLAGEVLRVLTEHEVQTPKRLDELFSNAYGVAHSDNHKGNVVHGETAKKGIEGSPIDKSLCLSDDSTASDGLIAGNDEHVENSLADCKVENEYQHILDIPGKSLVHDSSKDSPVRDVTSNPLKRKYESFEDVSDPLQFISEWEVKYDKIQSRYANESRHLHEHLHTLHSFLESLRKDFGSGAETVDNQLDASMEKHGAKLLDPLELDKHIPEIRYLKKKLGDFGNKDQVLNSLADLTTKAVLSDHSLPLVDLNSLLRLEIKLRNWSTQDSDDCFKILDDILNSQQGTK
ncbi:hypothetical protein Cantr_10543 [Candida viswanathii]|uniref:Uncharacterized protein n=1 Tax=Candida viswanathii TaxID=5486 RepID=A0A367YFP6_9ASCO|nr:hypothetical protein Cantr_10543 [Candida viswanathii]